MSANAKCITAGRSLVSLFLIQPDAPEGPFMLLDVRHSFYTFSYLSTSEAENTGESVFRYFEE